MASPHHEDPKILEFEDVFLLLVVAGHLAGGAVQVEERLSPVGAPPGVRLGVLVEPQVPLAQDAVEVHPGPAREGQGDTGRWVWVGWERHHLLNHHRWTLSPGEAPPC